MRTGILSGTLAPGQRLHLRNLASELGVSSLPVRAALARLRAEGLVVHVPHSGSIVSPLTYEEFDEIQSVRVGIEGRASFLGVRHLRSEDLDAMARRLDRLEELAGHANQNYETLAEFLAEEQAFKEICFQASGREGLVKLVLSYRRRAERYMRVVFSTPHRFSWSLSVQRVFFAACRHQDGVAAEQATRVGIEITRDEVAAHFGAKTDTSR